MIIISIGTFSSFNYPVKATDRVIAQTEQEVYICVSAGSYAYHKKEECHELKRCKQKIKSMTVAEAKEMGKSKDCGFCYKK